MIPIALREDRLREEIMTGILIQVKDKAAIEVVDINADELHFFPADCKLPRPYIMIVMQLGLQTASDMRHCTMYLFI
ncbi:hypothetical protein EW026_g7360 [Hermanssonia centrifuga]|uniref:Uncharacterized protein n=1 Tax=Hermanssonia centrifuga TaxID=98765 RepID=A0A4S4K861_9APHY|nr:hypothetical protein EW026_g7360 [Hermanssonia centrifuga]